MAQVLIGGIKMKTLLYRIVAASPVLILLYLIYLVAFNVPVIYTIDIGSEGDVDAGKDAYLRNMTSQGRLTRSMSIEGDTFRNSFKSF
ncbi:hypothetical protein METP2_00799 [Methanosarcinales archaeon]|nr:hypothetical protein METP2_00799 [Methanosarcinales archaeon]